MRLDLIARAVSVVGHPALLTPAVGLAALSASGAPARAVGAAAAIALVVAGVVLGYGWRQVRRGAWVHIDASRPAERRSHNRLGLAVLAAGAVVAALGAVPLLAAALAATAGIMAVAWLLSRWLKLSQHVAFAAFSAVLAWSIGPWPTAAVLLAVALLAWSRLSLGRHTPAEITVGGAVGLASGLLLALVAV